MRRCVIIGGAPIADYSGIQSFLNQDDYYVFCDSGLRHQKGLSACPDLIIGDFDSHENPHLPVETISLPTVKDDTDTAFAAKEAVRRGFKEILFLGAAGARADHTLVNIFLLFRLDSLGVKASLIDDWSEMSVVGPQPAFIDDSCLYFSLVNMTGTARGITIKDAKYELENAEITSEVQYATSNEVLPGKTASVCVKDGRLLLIKIRNE